jgi:hypothetical protein
MIFTEKLSFERDLLICIEISTMNSCIHLPQQIIFA